LEFLKEAYRGAVIYTYMQALGELGYDGFGGSEFPELYWSIFFNVDYLTYGYYA